MCAAALVEQSATFTSTASETNPMGIYVVKNDSKGDKLLFRYPFYNLHKPNVVIKKDDHLRKWPPPPNKREPKEQTAVKPNNLIEFSDDVISSLFAVKMDLCEQKFELKVNNVRFVGHPIKIQISGGVNDKPESPSFILFNIVFALDAFARRQIANCYYDLSKVLGVALKHEEKRCAYLSTQIKEMLTIHDAYTSR